MVAYGGGVLGCGGGHGDGICASEVGGIRRK